MSVTCIIIVAISILQRYKIDCITLALCQLMKCTYFTIILVLSPKSSPKIVFFMVQFCYLFSQIRMFPEVFRGLCRVLFFSVFFTLGRSTSAALNINVVMKDLAAVCTFQHHLSLAEFLLLAAGTVVHHDVLFHRIPAWVYKKTPVRWIQYSWMWDYPNNTQRHT